MSTISDLISQYTSQSELNVLLEMDKFGIINILSYANGATITDGVTDAYSAMNAAKSAIGTNKKILYFPPGDYYVGTSITYPSNVQAILADNAKLIPASASITIRFHTLIGGTYQGTGTVFQYNSASMNDIKVQSSNLDGSYGILLNSSLTGDNADILFNKIDGTSDPIEINTISEQFRGVKVIGNTLLATGTSTGTTSGFAIGIASGKDIVIVGNIVKESRREALHIESFSENITVVGNVFNNCKLDGIRLYNRSTAYATTITGNQINKSSTDLLTDYGIYAVNDSNGTLTGCNLSGNIIRGFDIGIFLNGNNTSNVTGCTIYDCNTAIQLASGESVGTIVAKNCPTLAKGDSRSIIGKIISITKPTTILDYTGTTNAIGATIKGFKFPLDAITTASGGTNTVTLFPLPSLIKGNLTMQISNGLNVAYYSASINYDGTNLSILDYIQDTGGVFSLPTLSISGSDLVFTFYSSSALALTPQIDFDGTFYLNT